MDERQRLEQENYALERKMSRGRWRWLAMLIPTVIFAIPVLYSFDFAPMREEAAEAFLSENSVVFAAETMYQAVMRSHIQNKVLFFGLLLCVLYFILRILKGIFISPILNRSKREKIRQNQLRITELSQAMPNQSPFKIGAAPPVYYPIYYAAGSDDEDDYEEEFETISYESPASETSDSTGADNHMAEKVRIAKSLAGSLANVVEHADGTATVYGANGIIDVSPKSDMISSIGENSSTWFYNDLLDNAWTMDSDGMRTKDRNPLTGDYEEWPH